jgi:hypothetical protein
MNLDMGGFRFVLVLVLAVVMDLGSPVLPEAGESFEELEEAAHGRRRLLRRVHVASPGTPAAFTTTALKVSRPAPRRSPTRATPVRLRKVPPPLPDPASASEDH